MVGFLNLTFSALLGPVFSWVLQHVSGGSEKMGLEHYQIAFSPMLFGVAAAIVFALAI